MPHVLNRNITLSVQPFPKRQTVNGTGDDAEPAPLAFFGINFNPTSLRLSQCSIRGHVPSPHRRKVPDNRIVLLPHEFVQLTSKLRMGDLDEGFGALPEILAMQVSEPVLGHDIMHIAAGSHDS